MQTRADTAAGLLNATVDPALPHPSVIVSNQITPELPGGHKGPWAKGQTPTCSIYSCAQEQKVYYKPYCTQA